MAIDGSRYLVTKEGGIHVTIGLKTIDPRQTEGCQFGDSECWVEGNKCGSMNCMYCVTCNACKEELDPETQEMSSIPGGVKSSHYFGMCAVSL